MATKEDNIKRLRELAVVLGREVDISGSAMEIRQRVMEWEEEAGAGSGEESFPGQKAIYSLPAPVPGAGAGITVRVTVRALKTLHIPAFTPEGREIADAVIAGLEVQIQECHFRELESAGLVCAV